MAGRGLATEASASASRTAEQLDEAKRSSLYAEDYEKDACGVGMIAQLQSKPSHKIVRDAIEVLERMEHRGGCGRDPSSGDGAGILTSLPHKFFAEELAKQKITLPAMGEYGVQFFVFSSHTHLLPP